MKSRFLASGRWFLTISLRYPFGWLGVSEAMKFRLDQQHLAPFIEGNQVGLLGSLVDALRLEGVHRLQVVRRPTSAARPAPPERPPACGGCSSIASVAMSSVEPGNIQARWPRSESLVIGQTSFGIWCWKRPNRFNHLLDLSTPFRPQRRGSGTPMRPVDAGEVPFAGLGGDEPVQFLDDRRRIVHVPSRSYDLGTCLNGLLRVPPQADVVVEARNRESHVRESKRAHLRCGALNLHLTSATIEGPWSSLLRPIS